VQAKAREKLQETWKVIFSRQGDQSERIELLAEVFDDIQSRLPLLTLRGMLGGLVAGLEQAAGTDDGLRSDEQSLLDRLREVRIAFETMDPNSEEDWARLGDLVETSSPSDVPPTNVVPFGINKKSV
ncbi:MAG TPA: hypothetical protein PK264_09930, partial [Hyphomicrobiaceae bacterium]|nr:hypothetical protein [Hyphomicrobiaceae bacterium]